jgi:hypothetical protein
MDEDSNTTEDSPWDVVGNAREVDSVPSTLSDVDMGAYEGSGSGACPGDVNHDGLVDVDDLVGVILTWGPCVTPPSGCAGDIDQPCGSGEVDVDDLVAVILGWGQCDDGFTFGDPGPLPESVQDCLDSCGTRYTPGSERYNECIGACVQSLYMTP